MRTITINETGYEIKEGMSQAVLTAFHGGADVIVKKLCPQCGFALPVFSGRYPNMCPVCGAEFEPKPVKVEGFGAYLDGKCVGLLNLVDEGKSGAESDVNVYVDHIMGLVKSGDIKNKKELTTELNKIKTPKSGEKTKWDAESLKNDFSGVVKAVGKQLKKDNVKL